MLCRRCCHILVKYRGKCDSFGECIHHPEEQWVEAEDQEMFFHAAKFGILRTYRG